MLKHDDDGNPICWGCNAVCYTFYSNDLCYSCALKRGDDRDDD